MNQNIFAVYKPKGPTSHDVIDEIRRGTGVKKVGHAGTLDPLAKGVLVVGIGRMATKQLDAVKGSEKEYLATIELGAVSKTDDSEGPIETKEVSTKPNIAEVNKLLSSFVGQIEQRPPAYSAVHVNGTKSYKLARQQEAVSPLPPRPVFVKNIELIKYHWPTLELKIVTGPGVYIRSIARDIGERLGVGAYLKELERTRVGDFTADKALEISKISEAMKTTVKDTAIVEYSEFKKIELRVVKIIQAEPMEGSEKLLKLQVELGEEKRQIIAGIGQHYQAQELVGMSVIIVANLAPRKLMGFGSQGMVLAASSEEKVVLLTPEKDIASGSEVA